MSRLDSAIRRLQAQKTCLDHAIGLIRPLAGPVLELGLGNGRSYDHLREGLPDREIFVFDRRVAAHPACIPEDRYMLLGDVRDTLVGAVRRIGQPAALAHCDIGSGDEEATRRLALAVGALLAPVLAPGAVVVSDQAMDQPYWQQIAPPPGVAEGRYFLYRAGQP